MIATYFAVAFLSCLDCSFSALGHEWHAEKEGIRKKNKEVRMILPVF
jgi:hypothetical protein